MRNKWVKYVAMGIALLMAIVMLASLIIPYINM